MPDYDAKRAERVRIIRELAQGEGLTIQNVASLMPRIEFAWHTDRFTPVTFQAYLVYTAAMSYSAREDRAKSDNDLDPVFAIRNALGLRPDGGLPREPAPKTLGERRLRLLESVDVSIRTLARQEQRGSEILCVQSFKTSNIRPNRGELVALNLGLDIHWTIRDASDDLLQRVEDIELLLAMMFINAGKPVDQKNFMAASMIDSDVLQRALATARQRWPRHSWDQAPAWKPDLPS